MKYRTADVAPAQMGFHLETGYVLIHGPDGWRKLELAAVRPERWWDVVGWWRYWRFWHSPVYERNDARVATYLEAPEQAEERTQRFIVSGVTAKEILDTTEGKR